MEEDKESENIEDKIQKYNGIYPRILIVDDQVFNIEAIKVILKSDGIDLNKHVMQAFNGHQALELVKERTADNMFHIIFMDCNMPFMDGCTASAHIRDFIDEQM